MTKPVKWIIAAVAVSVLVLTGVTAGIWFSTRDKPQGALDTELNGVTVSEGTNPVPTSKPKPKKTSDRRCWESFGGDPQRSLARPFASLGLPARKPLWSLRLHGYIEYQPSYCDGVVYVNTFRGDTFAVNADTGKVLWRRHGGQKPSTPAIDGPRLIVSSQDGTVTAFDRRNGKALWQVRTAGKVESSPVVVDGIAYFGSTDGRLFAVHSTSGRVKWAYAAGGRINSSPSVFGKRVCATTYSGSILCLRKQTGERLWVTYIKRDAFRYETFYASPSSDGARIYSVARSGKVVAIDASDGHVIWTAHVGGLGYTTPAVSDGRVFAGGFDGRLRAFGATTGAELWSRWVGGRILGAPVVIGKYVFFSTLEGRTYAARTSDGKIVWHLTFGKYSPGIATERTYYLSLNGRLFAYRGRDVGRQVASHGATK